jgi:hypothetical protein
MLICHLFQNLTRHFASQGIHFVSPVLQHGRLNAVLHKYTYISEAP